MSCTRKIRRRRHEYDRPHLAASSPRNDYALTVVRISQAIDKRMLIPIQAKFSVAWTAAEEGVPGFFEKRGFGNTTREPADVDRSRVMGGILRLFDGGERRRSITIRLQ